MLLLIIAGLLCGGLFLGVEGCFLSSLWLVLANGKDWSSSPPYHSFFSIFLANQTRTKKGMMFQDS
jgi:hypothetical protein